MLYLINGKYYMLRNREYVNVATELKDNELSIKPNRKDTIEANKDLKPRGILIDDVIKKLRDEEDKNRHRDRDR